MKTNLFISIEECCYFEFEILAFGIISDKGFTFFAELPYDGYEQHYEEDEELYEIKHPDGYIERENGNCIISNSDTNIIMNELRLWIKEFGDITWISDDLPNISNCFRNIYHMEDCKSFFPMDIESMIYLFSGEEITDFYTKHIEGYVWENVVDPLENAIYNKYIYEYMKQQIPK